MSEYDIDELEDMNEMLHRMESNAHNLRSIVLELIYTMRTLEDTDVEDEVEALEAEREELENKLEEMLSTFP